MEGEDKLKGLFNKIKANPEIGPDYKDATYEGFKDLITNNQDFRRDLHTDLTRFKLIDPTRKFEDFNKNLEQNYLLVSQPPPVSLAPPQRQSIEQQAAGQATGFVPPMAVQPEQPVFQPFVQFKNEAELQQTAKSPVFKDYSAASAVIADREKMDESNPLTWRQDQKTGKFSVFEQNDFDSERPLATFDTKQQADAAIRTRNADNEGLIMPFKDAETDFAKMSPEQQAQAIAGSTGSELAESKKPKPTLLQQGKQAISDIASSFNRSVFKAPSAIAKTVSELGTGTYNLMGGDAKVEQDYLYQIADKYDKWIDDSEFAKQFIGDKNVNSLAGDVGSGLGQIATMITAGGGSVAQGLKSAPSLLRGVAEKFLTPASGVAFSQVFSSEYDNMKAKGESDNTALKQALANAFVSAPLESIPLINLTERMNAINPSLTRKVINTLAQGFDEMTQERLQQAFSNVTNNQLAQLESSIVKWSEGLDRSGEAGGLTGLIIGAIGQARIKRTKTPEVSGPSGQPPTQLGGIPTIPAPPNAPEFVPPVPPPSGADQTTYETVSPEELQAFRQGQIDPERAAAIADDVALIQSGQMDINSIDDPNYRLMVESAMGVGQQQQQGTTQNVSLENKVKETESKIKNKGLFLAEVDENGNRVVDKETGRQSQSVGEIISQSDYAPVPTSVREINGIEFVEFSNPRTGDVDVIVTGKNDGSYVGYYRLYDNGKPTNQWSSKFENPSRNKEDFKTMISGVQSMLPEGHEYTEKTSISTDGLRIWEQQLGRGYELQTDENGNIITNKVAINGDAIVNELGIDVDKGSFENISVRNNIDIKKVRQALLPYLQKLGLNESNIYFENGTAYIDLPVLKKKNANATPQSETIVADQAAQNMGTAVNQPLETGAAAVEVGESGRPVVEVEGDQVVEEEVGEEEKAAEAPKVIAEIAKPFLNIDRLVAKGFVKYVDSKTGKPCAKYGMRDNAFSRGGQWEIVKDLKGYATHEKGGVDLTIDSKGVRMGGPDSKLYAADGLLMPGDGEPILPERKKQLAEQERQKFIQYMTHPSYKERLKKEVFSDTFDPSNKRQNEILEEEYARRMKEISNIPISQGKFSEAKGSEIPYAEYFGDESSYNQLPGGRKGELAKKGFPQIIVSEDASHNEINVNPELYSQVIGHELGHSSHSGSVGGRAYYNKGVPVPSEGMVEKTLQTHANSPLMEQKSAVKDLMRPDWDSASKKQKERIIELATQKIGPEKVRQIIEAQAKMQAEYYALKKEKGEKYAQEKGPNWYNDDFMKIQNNYIMDHLDQNATEVATRMIGLRRLAADKFGHDMNEDFDIKKYKDQIQDYYKKNNMIDEYNQLNKTLELSDDQINEMMKYIAKNNRSNGEDSKQYAADGLLIPNDGEPVTTQPSDKKPVATQPKPVKKARVYVRENDLVFNKEAKRSLPLLEQRYGKGNVQIFQIPQGDQKLLQTKLAEDLDADTFVYDHSGDDMLGVPVSGGMKNSIDLEDTFNTENKALEQSLGRKTTEDEKEILWYKMMDKNTDHSGTWVSSFPKDYKGCAYWGSCNFDTKASYFTQESKIPSYSTGFKKWLGINSATKPIKTDEDFLKQFYFGSDYKFHPKPSPEKQ